MYHLPNVRCDPEMGVAHDWCMPCHTAAVVVVGRWGLGPAVEKGVALVVGRQGLEAAIVEWPVGTCSLPSGAVVISTGLLHLLPSQKPTL